MYIRNDPLPPVANSTALEMFTIPEPCTNGSLFVSSAVDARIFFIKNGLYCSPPSNTACINTAAAPATIGAAMLVPPKRSKFPSFSLFIDSVTRNGTNAYAPVAIMFGFGSAIMLGPRLEKCAISPPSDVELPNRGCPEILP